MNIEAYAKIVVASLYTFCVALIVIGYQALLPVLYSADVYSYVCTDEERAAHASGNTQTCLDQKTRLDFMFTLTTSAVNIVGVFVGFLMVRIGPRYVCILGCFIVSTGAVLFAMGTNSFPSWTVGYMMMGGGGPFIAFSVFSLAGLVPKYSAFLFSIFVGVFDASAFMLLFMNLLNRYHGLTLRDMFLGFLIFPTSLIFVSFWLFPKGAVSTSVPEESVHSALLNNAEDVVTSTSINNGPTPIDDESHLQPPYREKIRSAYYEASHVAADTTAAANELWFAGPYDVFSVLRSQEFWIVAVWSACMITTKYFYIENVSDQLQYIDNGHAPDTAYIDFFSFLLPATGLATPFTGGLLYNLGVRWCVMILGVNSLVLSVISNLKGLPLAIQYVTMVIVCFNRFFYFSTAPMLLHHLFGEVGPSAIYPLVFAFSGIVNLSNFGWVYISTHNLDMNFLPMNVSLNMICCITSAVVYFYIGIWEKGGNRRAKELPSGRLSDA